MKQIDRINKYEKLLNETSKKIANYEKSLNEFNKIQETIKELDAYYGSNEWYKDLDDYEIGLLPKDIKVGILSEDAIYNTLMNNRELAINMLEIATKILKQ